MNMTLLLVLCVLTFFQKRDHFTAAAIFSVAWAIHALIDWPWESCYFSGAAIDVLVILLICRLSPRSDFCYRLLCISFLSIIANIYGWVLWFLYQPPAIYNAVGILLYIAAILVFLAGGSRRDFVHKWNDSVRLLSSTGLRFNRNLQEKERA